MVILDYYRIFYYVAQCRSFTKAAELLDNSQPNITRCMNNLENELDCRLFVRSNRGVSLTPEGERLFHYVSAGYQQILAGENQIKRIKNMEEGLITVGTSEIALHLLLLDKLEEFRGRYPQIHLQILNFSAPEAADASKNRLVDFSVVTTPLKIKQPLTKTSLTSFREILIGGIKYTYLSEKKHSIAEIAHLPFISLGRDTSTRHQHQQFFMEHNLSFEPDMIAATTDQMFPMIYHNLGIGFYPEELARRLLLENEIVEIPLLEEIPRREICLIQNTSHALSIAARKFVDLLLEGQDQ